MSYVCNKNCLDFSSLFSVCYSVGKDTIKRAQYKTKILFLSSDSIIGIATTVKSYLPIMPGTMFWLVWSIALICLEQCFDVTIVLP